MSLPSTSTAPCLQTAQDELADVFGGIAEFWGFTRTQGRVFGLLFLSPRPLGQRAIRHRLGISAGSASMTLASLGRWGALHRRGRHYMAETDLWRLITAVFQRREREQVDRAIARVTAILEQLQRGPADDPDVAFASTRVQHLLQFFRLGRSFLDAFVARRVLSELLDSIARRAAKIPPFSSSSWEHDVRVGA